MWKPGSVLNRRNRYLWFALLLCIGTACSVNASPSAVPTRTLIPATITDTPTPVVPTATPLSLPGPQDIDVTLAPVFVPAAAQPLVGEIMDDLAASLDIALTEVELALIEEATWTNSDLGCTTNADLEQAVAGYRLVLLVGDTAYEYHTDSTSFRRCGQGGVDVGETSLLVDIDPVAAELAALAQRRLSQELSVPASRVRVLEVTQYIWTDSSLGCPQAGEEYPSVQIDGYRIRLTVGDEEYVFHTDFDRLLACDAEDERLPEATEEAALES
jgi:hypothetical protein